MTMIYAAPNGTVNNIYLQEVSSSSMTLTWQPMPCLDKGFNNNMLTINL